MCGDGRFKSVSDEIAQLLLEPEDSLDALLLAALNSYEGTDSKAVPTPTSPTHSSTATPCARPFA